jgi:hypothetical protein
MGRGNGLLSVEMIIKVYVDFAQPYLVQHQFTILGT